MLTYTGDYMKSTIILTHDELGFEELTLHGNIVMKTLIKDTVHITFNRCKYKFK